MFDKPPPSGTPADFTEALAWVWVAGLSVLGGVASFLQKLRTGHVRAWNFTEFIGEITSSGLTGIITANLADSMALPAPMKYALVGIASHMGSRALFKLEAVFSSKFGLPPEVPDVADVSALKEPDHAA